MIIVTTDIAPENQPPIVHTVRGAVLLSVHNLNVMAEKYHVQHVMAPDVWKNNKQESECL